MPINCSCYTNAMAGGISIKELTAVSGEARMTALRPKIDAAVKRCATN
jgi:hypothetical protein